MTRHDPRNRRQFVSTAMSSILTPHFTIFLTMKITRARMSVLRDLTSDSQVGAAVIGGRVESNVTRLFYSLCVLTVASMSWIFGHRNASPPPSVLSCTSPALEIWKSEIFGRAMTLSKRSDFLARRQEEPKGHLRFSLFDAYDHCKTGNPTKVGGEGDGTAWQPFFLVGSWLNRNIPFH